MIRDQKFDDGESMPRFRYNFYYGGAPIKGGIYGKQTNWFTD